MHRLIRYWQNYFGDSSVSKGCTDRLMNHYGNVINIYGGLPVFGNVYSRDLFITKPSLLVTLCKIVMSNSVMVLQISYVELVKKKHLRTVSLVTSITSITWTYSLIRTSFLSHMSLSEWIISENSKSFKEETYIASAHR